MIVTTNKLKLGACNLSIIVATSMTTSMAYAQTAGTQTQANASSNSVEEVTVTGTSIRGIAPIGSNLITVDATTMKETGAQTLQQVFAATPVLTGFGMIGQGQTNNSFLQPTIHQLGGSSSNATLVIIDGHRSPTGSTNHSNQVDPGIIPANMIQRVEILPDGSSSVYGSDAITGVINMITRKDFEGVQLSGQYSFMDGATDRTFGVLAGTNIGTASVIFGATHTNQGSLLFSSRPQTNPNHIAQGGSNFNNYNCDPATVQPNGAGNVFLTPTATTSVANTAANAPCSNWQYTSLLPNTVRNNAMLKGSMNVGTNLTLTADMLYSNYRDTFAVSRGLVTGTAFGPGSAQANPFYVAPPGVVAPKETIKWDADALLGPGARTWSGTEAFYTSVGAEYHINDNFVVNLLANAGTSTSVSNSDGTVNNGVAFLALNGTTNAAGNPATPSVVGTNTAILSFPLTAGNALDVWNPAGSNRTSASVLSALTNNSSRLSAVAGYQQFRGSITGTIFDLPAGPVKAAFGAEYFRQQLTQQSSTPNNTGPATQGSSVANLSYNQNVTSAYAEIAIPVVSPEMAIPLIHKFEVDVSGRWDNYDTVGVTKNPKVAFSWDLIEQLKVRGTWSTSFVAPVLDGRGTLVNGAYTGYGVGNTFGGTTNNVNVPVALYPLVTQLGIPGCTAASVTCNIANINGIIRSSGDPNLKPERGHGYTLGVDYKPDFLPGFIAQVTYWSNTLLGGITAPNLNNVVNAASLTNLLTFIPGCATPAQISTFQGVIPLTTALPACAQYLQFRPNTNVLDLKPSGIDASFNYQFDTDAYGAFRIGDTLTMFTQYTEAFGGGPYYNVLNTTGANGSFPSVAIASRANLGWSYQGYSADLFINYTSAYKNWSGNTLNPIVFDSVLNPAGGGDHVNAFVTLDLNVSYSFSTPWFGDDEINVTARNLLNSYPPFYNSSGGWDTWVANPLGRVITVGLTAKL